MREASLAVQDKPRRRLDRETTPGRCGNLDYCSIGMQRIQLRVALSQPFNCPECGSPLRAPVRRVPGQPLVLPVLRLTVLAVAIGWSLAMGYAAGRARGRVDAAVVAAGSALDADLHEAKAALGLAPAPEPPRVAADTAPGVDTPRVFVSERGYPARLPPVDSARPAPRLGGEARFGQVTLDCVVAPLADHPACQVTDIRGADPFSAAAVAWLQGLSVQYAPTLRGGASVSLAHRWRVVLADYAGKSRGD